MAMPTPIPKAWQTAVCKVLSTCDARRIRITARARNDWESTFPNFWMHSLYGALSDALSAPSIEGQRRYMDEEGETYEFFFTFEGVNLYAKVNL